MMKKSIWMGAVCGVLGLSTPVQAADCKTYAKQTQQERVDMMRYCNEMSEQLPEKLFPEFAELSKQRTDAGQEMTEADFISPEKSWCGTVDSKRIKALKVARAERTDGCKQAFQALFSGASGTGKTLASILPKDYVVLTKEDKAPIAHDFNGDGVADYVFLIASSEASETARLMVALSEKDGQLKRLPVAPYIVGNFGENTGRPDTGLRLLKPDAFLMVTQSLDINNWDQRSEWLFRFDNGGFKLARSTSGFTRISYDESQPGVDESSVRDYAKGVAYKSSSERCDYYNVEDPTARCESAKDVTLSAKRFTLADFTDE